MRPGANLKDFISSSTSLPWIHLPHSRWPPLRDSLNPSAIVVQKGEPERSSRQSERTTLAFHASQLTVIKLNLPSNDAEACLQSPPMSVFDVATLEENPRTKKPSGDKLPDHGRNPREVRSHEEGATQQWKTYHSQPRRHSEAETWLPNLPTFGLKRFEP